MMNTLQKTIFAFLLAMFTSMTWSAQTITYYHLDALGSPVAATNEQGNVVWKEAYEPYGERIRNEAASSSNDVWFTGKQEDSRAGLSYFGARWYDPVVGRFMGIDPVGFEEGNPHTYNRFAYANNNPYKYVDPDGRASKVATLIRLTSSGAKSLARLTKEQAVRARKKGLNVHADRRSVATQIEKAAHGEKNMLKHQGHNLKDGTKGMPHMQTEGKLGHTFWGVLTSSIIAVSVGLDVIADAVEVVDPTTYITSGDNYLDKNGNVMTKDQMQNRHEQWLKQHKAEENNK